MKRVCLCVRLCQINMQSFICVYPVNLIWKLLMGFDWGSGGQANKHCKHNHAKENAAGLRSICKSVKDLISKK